MKNKAILRDFLQKWKVECRADGLVPMQFAIFPLHLCKVLGMPRKSDARPCESRKAENPRMDRKVVGAVFFGLAAMVAVVTWSVTSPTTARCSVV